MLIYPEILITPDLPTIKFHQPRDQVKLDIELPRILHNQGWGCGTYFHVQFMNHEKTELLACALYVVTKEVEGIHTSDNQYQPMTKTVYTREAKQVGSWWVLDSGKLVEVSPIITYMPRDIPRPEDIVDPPQIKATATWNPGRKMHQVKIDGKVVYETPDKEEARKVAAGEIRIPKAA